MSVLTRPFAERLMLTISRALRFNMVHAAGVSYPDRISDGHR